MRDQDETSDVFNPGDGFEPTKGEGWIVGGGQFAQGGTVRDGRKLPAWSANSLPDLMRSNSARSAASSNDSPSVPMLPNSVAARPLFHDFRVRFQVSRRCRRETSCPAQEHERAVQKFLDRKKLEDRDRFRGGDGRR
jgi:hypothetical protein